MKRLLPALLVAATLVAGGCSGGGGTAPIALPAAGGANVTAAPLTKGTLPVTLRLTIPNRATPSAKARTRPSYVSASTRSISVGADGGPPALATTNCVAGAVCVVTVGLTPGTHSLAVRLWDAANAAGHELASNTAAPCAIVIDTANTCSVTLYGLAASLLVTSASPNVSGSQTAGFTYVSGAATPFTIAALDADGNTIAGVGGITPAVSSAASGISIATPAPNASPAAVYSIVDTNTSAQPLVVSATPGPHSDGANLSANVTLTGAGLYAGSLFFFSSSKFDVVSATTGVTTLSITNPLSGAPFAAATNGKVLLNAASSGTLSIFDIASGVITQTVTTGCVSTDNVPIAADGGKFFYDCSGTVYAYDAATGASLANWPDSESSTGYVAAGGGFVYTISGTTVHVFDSSGNALTTFTVANFPNPTWAFAASSQGLFVGGGTTQRLYSPTGVLLNSVTTSTPQCDFQPVGTYLTVRTGSRIFTTYNVATSAVIGTVTTVDTPSDCRVGFSN